MAIMQGNQRKLAALSSVCSLKASSPSCQGSLGTWSLADQRTRMQTQMSTSEKKKASTLSSLQCLNCKAPASDYSLSTHSERNISTAQYLVIKKAHGLGSLQAYIFWVLFMIATIPDHGVNLFPGSMTLCNDTCQGLPLYRQQIIHLQNHLGQLLKAEKSISTFPLTSPSSLLNLHSSIHLNECQLSNPVRIQETRVKENISPAFPGGTRPF